MQDILPSNLRKNFSYLALLAMQHDRLAFQNSFSVWTTLEEVEQHGEPELQACARHLHKEESAVQAGLTLAWSNGPTEGFIHRLKLLKRQAYGRAGVALLKQRMLFHPSDLIAA